MAPKVSIIVPVYNAEKYLHQCMDGILSQTLRAIEIICVDDGSTDRSLDILRSYAAHDDRVRLLTQTNQYAGVARNNGLQFARGDYVIFLDSDDFFEPDFVEKVYTAANQNETDVTVFEYKLFYSKQRQSGKRSWGIHIPLRDVFCLADLKSRHFTFTNIAVWNKIYRRQFLIQNKIFYKPYKALNDVHFSWFALASAERISLVKAVGAHYRIGTGTSISDLGHSSAYDHFKAFSEIEVSLRSIPSWPKLRHDFKHAQIRQFYDFFRKLLRERAGRKTDGLAFEENFNKYLSDLRAYLVSSTEDFSQREKEKIRNSKNYLFITNYIATGEAM